MNKNINQKNKKGFSFLEVIISTFIFSLVIVVAVSAFASSFSAQKTVRKEQRNLEEARTAMETMAKNIRMSSNLVPSNPSGSEYKTIAMFNNSQSVCLRYHFTGVKLTVARGNFAVGVNVPLDCSNGVIAYSAPTELISIPVDGRFRVVKTSTVAPEKIGKATILINIGSGSELQNIQTTVSFRDYEDILQRKLGLHHQ